MKCILCHGEMVRNVAPFLMILALKPVLPGIAMLFAGIWFIFSGTSRCNAGTCEHRNRVD